MDKEIKKIKEEMDKIDEELSTLQTSYRDFLGMDIIKKFKEVEGLLKMTVRERIYLHDQYKSLVQKNCPHPLWYLCDSMTDDFEGRTYWTCKCVECEQVKEGGPRDFKNVITGNKNLQGLLERRQEYEEVKSLYHKLDQFSIYQGEEKFTIDKETTAQLLVRRFNNKRGYGKKNE